MTTLLLVWHPALLGSLGPARPLLYPAEAADELQIIDAGGLALEAAVGAALRWVGEGAPARWRLIVAAPPEPFEAEMPPALTTLLAAGAEQISFLLLGGAAAASDFGEVSARFDHLDSAAPSRRLVVRAPTLFERSGTAPFELAYLLLYLVGGAPNLPFESYLGSGGIRLDPGLGTLNARYGLGLERAARELEAAPIEVAASLFDEVLPAGEGVVLPETERDLVALQGAPGGEIPAGWIARRPRERDHDSWLLWRDAAERELQAAETAIEERGQSALAGGLERLSELREARGARPAGVRLQRDALREQTQAVDAALEALALPTAPGGSLTLERWRHRLWLRLDAAFRRALARRPALPQLIIVPFLALAPLLLAGATEREQGLPWLLIAALTGFVAALGLTIDGLRRPLGATTQAIRTKVRDRLQALSAHQKGSRNLIGAQLGLWQNRQNGRVLAAAAEELRRRTRLHEYHEGQLRRHLSWQREIAAGFPAADPPPPPTFEATDWRRDVAELPLYRPSDYAEGGTPPMARCDESELVLPLPRFAGLAGIDLTSARRA